MLNLLRLLCAQENCVFFFHKFFPSHTIGCYWSFNKNSANINEHEIVHSHCVDNFKVLMQQYVVEVWLAMYCN